MSYSKWTELEQSGTRFVYHLKLELGHYLNWIWRSFCWDNLPGFLSVSIYMWWNAFVCNSLDLWTSFECLSSCRHHVQRAVKDTLTCLPNLLANFSAIVYQPREAKKLCVQLVYDRIIAVECWLHSTSTFGHQQPQSCSRVSSSGPTIIEHIPQLVVELLVPF